MTDFNAPGAMLSLDEYYEQCVIPKPKIPARYPRNAVPQSGKRQAGHLRSYKESDQGGDDDVEDEDFHGSVLKTKLVENGAAEIYSNVAQINFERNEFDKVYWEQDSHSSKASQSSAMGRMYGNNVYRPSEADQLVPNDQARGDVKSRLDLRYGSRFRNNLNHQQNVHRSNEIHRRQHHVQNAKKQHLRTAYNAFNSQTIHANQQTDVLKNINNHFQYTHQEAIDLRRSTNIEPDHYDWTDSSSIGSLLESLVHIPDIRVKNRLPCETITRYTDISKDILAGEGQNVHSPQTGLDPVAVDSESMKVSKMAHNVMLLLKSVAQQNNLG